MGMASAAVQAGQTTANNSNGKGQPSTPPPQSIQTNWGSSQPMGKGGYTNSATSGQPRVGQANQYSNTVGVGDNTDNSTLPTASVGKAKGA